MSEIGVRAFDPSTLEWEQHPLFASIQVKALETKATHPAMSMLVVRVAVDGVIETHVHKIETESAVVLRGQGVIIWGDDQRETPLTVGQGVTIHPGTPHGLRNTGAEPLELLAMHAPGIR